jgi:hypothetical protein
MRRLLFVLLAVCSATASLHVFSETRVPLACVSPDTASVHFARGPFKKTPSLDTPAMWGHPEWMTNDIGAPWTRARTWQVRGDHVFISE